MVPWAVMEAFVGNDDNSLDACVCVSLASPKSSNFVPDLVSMMLPGLRSRCTIP